MVYNISDRITLGGKEIFLESILLMKKLSVLNTIYHLLKTIITENIIIFIIKKKIKKIKIPQMVYNIRDWVTQGGMVLFSESILLMKIAVLNTKQKKNPTNGI